MVINSGINLINGNIFDGSYSIEIPQNGGFVYFQSGGQLIDSGYLKTGNSIISGLSSTPSNVSGYIYYNLNLPIYGLCHGIGSDANVWYNGYNFYNGFHQEGYFAPPFGQNLSVYLQNDDGEDAIAEDGSCASLTPQEYNDLFGICTQLDDNINASTEFATSFINSPAIACPQDISVTFYWHEIQYNIIAGTAAAITANSFFNSNPIPTSLDNFSIKTSQRYASTTSGLAGLVDNGDGTFSTQSLVTITYANNKPVPNYITSAGYSTFNNGTCPGALAEGSLFSQIPQAQLLDDPDVAGGDAQGTFDIDNWWHLWHFLYEENSDGFPFFNNYDNDGNDEGLSVTSNQSNQGSELFEFTLSDSDAYWERRQCAETISFLPHTFGGSIYACPSYYFDIPYYAAIKKFGFFGTRFLDGCVSLDMEYSSIVENPLSLNPISGATNVTALQVGITDLDLPPNGYSYTIPQDSEPQPDVGTNGNFNTYDNLLNIASAEETQTDFFALNTTLFLWANSGLIINSPQYQSLSGNNGFVSVFNNMFSQYNAAFPGYTGDLINLNNGLFISGADSQFYNTGYSYTFLSNNDIYKTYKNLILKTLNDPNDLLNWNFIENNYGTAVLQSLNSVHTDFYRQLNSGKLNRLQNRYLSNIVNGNPIDLFPTNKIYFSYDSAGNIINSTGWGKSPFGNYGPSATFDDAGLSKRYFLGAYGDGESIVEFENFVQNISNINVNNFSFYPGHFDVGIGNNLPTPSYIPVNSGIYGTDGQFSPIGPGWLALGYNGIGQLQNNFSCFTPMFIQQPFNKTYCKIGQSPTFRALAVDYHTIPEDKINIRYPEIVYWTTKLKTVDGNYNNIYPLAYKWYRIPITSCTGTLPNNSFDNFILNPDFSLLEPSNATGNWCALEGDGPYCTLIHPSECVPAFSPNPAWAYANRNTSLYAQAQRNNFNMTVKKGAILGVDDQYYYFCMVQGRFGIRISESSKLYIEDWLAFDVSVQNGGNVGMAPPTITFQGSLNGSQETISVSAEEMVPYDGFRQDNDFIPEDVIRERLPPPNAGYGDVYSWTFVGMWGYAGAAQTYSPGTLNGSQGLSQDWGRLLHYGNLKQYFTELTQSQGDLLYGTNHLPSCVNKVMPEGQEGIKVMVDGMVHWANMQTPIVDTQGNRGVLWSALGNAGELYPPVNATNNGGIDNSVSPGIGQWQWGNNLGTIHNFGWNSDIQNGGTATTENINNGDVAYSPFPFTEAMLAQLKSNLLKDNVLGGKNCGWNKYGLGRNMLYWIEGFSSFYLFCDPLKKKNVTNFNYMSPGLRQTNSSMQYFWLGKPNNSYLDRYPLFGPYAYEWKVRKHNRDRNGNGFSEGFYSYGWNGNYTQQYDAPSIYGLFIKYKSRTDTDNINFLNAGRTAFFGVGMQSVKVTSFGFVGDAGQEGIKYGNEFIGNIDTTETPTALYVNAAGTNAGSQQVNLYGCSDEDLQAGNCFDPCISMRYQMGFLPGGKKQLFSTSFPEGGGYNIVPNNPVVNGTPTDETYEIADTFFRGAFGTPHLKYLKSKIGINNLMSQELNGFSPCFDGGADHCNYITPTLNLGTSMYLETNISQFINNASLAAQAVSI